MHGRGTAHDHARPGRLGVSGSDRLGQSRGVVAVDVLGMPAEGSPLFGDGFDRRDRVDRTVDLGVIGVEEHDEAVQPEVTSEDGRLPNLPSSISPSLMSV